MNDVALALRQIGAENRSFWRNPAAAGFTFVFPLMFLVIFNAFFDEGAQFFVPSISAFSVISACYTNIAISTTFARDQGVLKRARGTPLPAWAYMAGRIGQATLVALLLVAIVATAGALFYDVDLPTGTLGEFLLTVIVGSASFSALALAITGFIPNADAAPPYVNLSILPLLFISGIFFPSTDAPDWLNSVASAFPVKPFAEAMAQSFNPGATASGVEVANLALVLAWGIAGALVAVRYFSWEPRR